MKKTIAFATAALMLLALFGCGGIGGKDLAGSTVTALVEGIDGSVITLRVMGNGGAQAPEGQTPPDMQNGGTPQFPNGDAPDIVNGASEGNGANGQMPRLPDGAELPDGQMPRLPDGAELPDGQTPPNFGGGNDFRGGFGNGQTPQLPDGQQGGFGNGQTPPQLPDGVTPPDMQNGDGFDGGNQDGDRDGSAPDGAKIWDFTAGLDGSGKKDEGETITVDLATLTYSDGVEAVKAEDLKVGSFVEVTFDSSGAVSSVKIVSAPDFRDGGGRQRERNGDNRSDASGSESSGEESSGEEAPAADAGSESVIEHS